MDAIHADTYYNVIARCPACRRQDEIQMLIQSRLERLPGQAKLGLKMQAQKLDHDCEPAQ